jgi:hypothetical protein
MEKIPFFALSAAFCAVTYEIQKNFAAVVSFDHLGLSDRLDNAIVSYVSYLAKLIWPAKLAVIYPYATSTGTTDVWLPGLLLLAISALFILQFSRRPYLAAGWFWYLVAMLPVIGLVQVGQQAMADRYTYIPLHPVDWAGGWPGLARDGMGRENFYKKTSAYARIRHFARRLRDDHPATGGILGEHREPFRAHRRRHD